MKRFTILILTTIVVLLLSACANEVMGPPTDLKTSDLAGTWVAEYGPGVSDTITIRSNGTFKQVFEDTEKNYIFDSGWQKWTSQQVSKDFIYLHLDGARYFLEGITIGEMNGKKNPNNPCLESDCKWGQEPRIFYDPFTETTIQMTDELILLPLKYKSKNLVLHHVWTSSDRGFAILDGYKEIFFKRENLP